MKELTQEDKDINNFDNIISPLEKHIRKHWDVKDLKPKGYDEFVKDYEDFKGMQELDAEALKKEFKGYADQSPGSDCFPILISLPHVAYSERYRGRPPLRELIGACIRYGMLIQKERDRIPEQFITDLELMAQKMRPLTSKYP
jgi:hypothetical protein